MALTEEQKRDLAKAQWYAGVRASAINTIIWDRLDPDEVQREDEDLEPWMLVQQTLGVNEGAVDIVLDLLDRVYNQGYRMATADIERMARAADA